MFHVECPSYCCSVQKHQKLSVCLCFMFSSTLFCSVHMPQHSFHVGRKRNLFGGASAKMHQYGAFRVSCWKCTPPFWWRLPPSMGKGDHEAATWSNLLNCCSIYPYLTWPSPTNQPFCILVNIEFLICLE